MKFTFPITVDAASEEAALRVRNYVKTAIGNGFNAGEFDDVATAHTGDLDLVEDPDDVGAILAARECHGEEGRIEIDDNAKVSYSTDGGAYVQGWLWIDDDMITHYGGSNPETGAGMPADDERGVEHAPAEDTGGGHCD